MRTQERQAGVTLEAFDSKDEARHRVVTGGALGAQEGYFKVEET